MAPRFNDTIEELLAETLRLQQLEAQPSVRKAQVLLDLLLSDTSKAKLDDPNMSDGSEPNIPETELYARQDGTTLTGDLIMDANSLLTKEKAEELAKFT